MNVPERSERECVRKSLYVGLKEKIKQQLVESKATVRECESEITIISSEIERLQEQKNSLSNIINYIEVVFVMHSLTL